MKTAALVLAILAAIFGALGAILALVFGSFAATIPAGLGGGTAIANNAMWALAAIVVGIIGAALIGRRPRVGAAMFATAAVVGMIGTAAFALGALLYVIAAGLAFFVKPGVAAAAPPVAAASALPTAAASGPSSGRPGLRRRSAWAALGAAVLIVGVVAAAAIMGQAAEQRPATALFDAIQRGDDAALAALLPSAARSGNPTLDAQTALRTALGSSSLAFLTQDWLRSLGPTTGTTMAFENLKTATLSKTEDKGVVRMTGVFAPSNPNPLANAALQIVRVGFQADVPTIREGSSWYLAAGPGAGATPTQTPAGPGSGNTVVTPTPTPERLRVTSGPTVSNLTTADATITWSTNKPSTSQVLYGLTNQFGSLTAVDPSLVTSHHVQLTGLTPSTLYHLFGRNSTQDEMVTSDEVTLTTATPQTRLIPGSYPQAAAAVDSTIAGWHAALRNVTVREDGSIQMDFDVTVGSELAWDAQTSYLRRSDGQRVANIQAQGVFHPGSARGSVVKNALAFPSGLAGYQPFTIKICALDNYCYYPDIIGPTLPEAGR